MDKCHDGLPMIQMTKKRESTLVGLQIEAGSVAAAEVRTNGAPKLTATAIASLPPEVFHDGEVADGDALAEALRSLFTEHKLSRRVRLGIANQWVVVRNLRLPAIDDPKELEAAVRFQAQEQIPMPVDQAVLDHRVVGAVAGAEGAAPQIDVVVVAARREMIEASIKPLRDAGLRPVGVDLSAFGLIRAFGGSEVGEPPSGEGTEPGEAAAPAILYCHVGAVTNLAVARQRACLFTRVSPVGLENVAADLAASSNLPREDAGAWLHHVGLEQPTEAIEGDAEMVVKTRKAMEGGASSLLDELRLSLDFYGAQEGSIPVERVVLCGPGSAIPGLAAHMEAALGLPFANGRPEALSGLDATSAARLTLSYGLALDL
jgi:type IV pilus assembly protein PilM